MTESYIKANINPLINSKKAESKPHIKYLVQNGAIDEIKTRVSGNILGQPAHEAFLARSLKFGNVQCKGPVYSILPP